MKNIEKLKQMNADELAQRITFDKEGEMRSPCGICAKHNDCDDNCYHGVRDWLEMEEE